MDEIDLLIKGLKSCSCNLDSRIPYDLPSIVFFIDQFERAAVRFSTKFEIPMDKVFKRYSLTAKGVGEKINDVYTLYGYLKDEHISKTKEKDL